MPWQLSSQIPINPIHAALGRTGKILFFGGSGNDPSHPITAGSQIKLESK